jgi:hypothetical protein
MCTLFWVSALLILFTDRGSRKWVKGVVEGGLALEVMLITGSGYHES